MPRHLIGARIGAAMLAAAFCAVLWPATPAAADAVLQSSNPRDGATVDAVPDAVTLTFNEVIQGRFTTVAVRDGNGRPVRLGQQGSTRRATVTQPMPADLPPGDYTVAYRIVSADGHPVSGRIRFTVAAPPVAAPIPSTSPATPAVAGPSDPPAAAGASDPATTVVADELRENKPDEGAATGLWLAGAALLVLAVVATAVLRSRRRRPA